MAVLTDASLTTNLKLCLDAGDSASYDPSVQTNKWLDRSGGGYDFFRGSGTGSDAADPTFTGIAGATGSYWAFDGGDYFTYDTTNEAWMQTIHKDNAIFSIVAFYFPTVGVNGLIGNSAAVTGFQFINNSGISFQVDDAGGTTLSVSGDSSVSNNAYHMAGISLNEATGAGGGFLYLDGNYEQVSSSDTFNSTYSSPSISNASYTLQIAANGNAYIPVKASSRLAAVAVWQGTALTKANMDTIWAAMRGRFGI